MRTRRRVKKKDPLESAVFFIDRSVGRKIAGPLRDAEFTVELHDDHFAQDAPDEEWLTEVGHRRWFVITRDERIRYRYLEATAAYEARVGLFVLVSKNLTGLQTAEAIIKARNHIRRFISSHRRPFIAKVYRDGRVQKLDIKR